VAGALKEPLVNGSRRALDQVRAQDARVIPDEGLPGGAAVRNPVQEGQEIRGVGPGGTSPLPEQLAAGVVMASAPSATVESCRQAPFISTFARSRQGVRVIRLPDNAEGPACPAHGDALSHPPSSLADRRLDGPTPAPEECAGHSPPPWWPVHLTP
jgi:hypothetical protein